jgi:hypothetical protein
MQSIARRLSERARAWWLTPAPALRLGLLRIAVGSAALAQLAYETPSLLAALGFLPRQFQPVGLALLLSQPVAATTLYVCLVACFVLGLGFVLGLAYEVTAPAFALSLLALMTYRSSWGMVLHTDNLLVLHVMLLSLAPAAAAASLDARRARARGHVGAGAAGAAEARFGWPLRVLSIATVSCYVLAGVAKLKLAGGGWLGGELLRSHIAYDNLRKLELGAPIVPLGPWLVRHAPFFPALAVGTLVLELGAPLALLRKSWATLWSVAAWGFHLGVLLTMSIGFTYQLSGVAYLSFFALERAASLASAKLRGSS